MVTMGGSGADCDADSFTSSDATDFLPVSALLGSSC